MTTSLVQLLVGGFVLALVQFLAALPWVGALTLDDPRDFVRWSFLRRFVPRALLGVVLAGLLGSLGLCCLSRYGLVGIAGRVSGAARDFERVRDGVVLR